MSMKHIIEVSKILTKKKVKKIEILDEKTLKIKNSKFNEFYESLIMGKFKNDREAAMQLYGCAPTDDRYRQLKSRFRKRLLNTLFFIDINTPGTDNYNRAYFTVNKEWALVKILLTYGANDSAAAMARQILTVALKFKFADVIVNTSRILRQDAMENADEKEFEVYDQYCKQYQNVLDAEIRSEELYQRVAMNYHAPAMKATDLHERIDTYCNALIGLSEIYDSPIITNNMHMVWIYRYEMTNDYDSMIEICKEAKKYIQNNSNYYREDKLQAFYLKEITAYLHKRDFANGKKNIEECFNDLAEGSDEWYEFLEYYLFLSMHTNNYLNAIDIINMATENLRFKKQSSIIKAKWEVFSNYLLYAMEINPNLAEHYMPSSKRAPRILKLSTEAFSYPKEQRILHIHMLLLQTLFLINNKNYDIAEEKIEKLKFIANRQLIKEHYVRFISFIKLLSQLAKAGFKPSEISLEEKYYSRLTSTPFKYKGLISELEVIPFEVLWADLMKNIRAKS